MKKIFFIGFSLIVVLIFSNWSASNDNGVMVESKDTKLPDWQWTSGQVEMKTTAAKQCFTITFSPKIFRIRDSVKIIFTTYKVSITNLDKAKKFGQWQAKVGLVRFINNNWIPFVEDTLDRINLPFSAKNNAVSDSITNYCIHTTVPLSRTLTLTTSALSFEMDNASGSPILSNGKMGVTLTTTIRGIEVKKPEHKDGQ